MAKRVRNSREYLDKQNLLAKRRYLLKREEALSYQKEYRKNLMSSYQIRLKRMLSSSKIRATKKGIPFDITLQDLISMWNQSEGKCCISGVPFEMPACETEYRVSKNVPSLDRIVPSKGYVKDNVRLVTWQVNAAISEYGLPSLIEMCNNIIEFNRKNT